MRVLLRLKRDDSLTIVEASKMHYDPSSKILSTMAINGQTYIVDNIEFTEARRLITALYDDGKISLTGHIAKCDKH